MAPQSQDKDKHSLNPDQTKLLCEVITKANVALTPVQWNKIAANLGISNGKAAKERFRYMMNSLSGLPTRAARSEDGAKEPSTPKSTAKKGKTPSTPASGRNKAGKESAKKRKIVDEEEPATMNGTDDDANEAEDDVSAVKTPKTKKAKKLNTPFRTPKKTDPQESSDGDEAESDTTKVNSSTYSGTTQTETPKPQSQQNISDTEPLKSDNNRDLDTYFDEEGFGAIGGGEGSMFPDNDDVI